MAVPAVGSDSLQAPDGTPGCWRGGDFTVQASLVRLSAHPEVGVCFRFIPVLERRKRESKRRTRAAPVGSPLWRRVRYRAGSGRCKVEIACAECGCLVDRGVIVSICANHTTCCCGELPIRRPVEQE